MARFGRSFPLPRRRIPRAVNLAWVIAGVATASSSAAGAIRGVIMFAGVAPSSSSAPGRVVITIRMGGVAPAAASAGSTGGLTIVGPNLRDLAAAALVADTTRILRRVDLYEVDGATLVLEDVDVVDGSITVSHGAGPRRTCTFTLNGDDGALLPDPAGLWFGKVLKAWRGVILEQRDGEEYWEQVGEFDIEPLDTDHFPADLVKLAGADYMARLARAHFSTVTTFGVGQTVESVVEQIATYGGLTKFRLETTGRYLGAEWQVETTTNLADAIQKVTRDHGCEAIVERDGYLAVRVVPEPAVAPTAFEFTIGPAGSIAGMSVSKSGARLYNHVVVRGESSDPAFPAVWAEAENTEPSSPTRIYDPDHPELGGIPRTTFTYVSPMITTEEQAQTVADALLVQRAILDVKATIAALVVPWLDAGTVVAVEDPNPAPSDPPIARWQLEQFTIPWTLGATDYQGSRAVRVGSS